VVFSVKAAESLEQGDKQVFTIQATSFEKKQKSIELVVEIVTWPKIYFVSIDSLHPDYLKLNKKGTGFGRDGDWLMPNLHQLLSEGSFFPEFQSHIITATDMNHFNMLAGTMTGTAGVPLVGATLFGFKPDGSADLRPYPLDLTFYGPEGKRVETLYHAVKEAHPLALTAFISGKNWVPELLEDPGNKLDLIINGERIPDYLSRMEEETPLGLALLTRLASASLFGSMPDNSHPLGNPAGLQEKQDSRADNYLSRFMSAMPNRFPPDAWVMDATLKLISHEDPDILYSLLAAVDDAGHAFGSAYDLEEWDDRGSDDLSKHVSVYDPKACRQGILNVVREADRQFGRLLDDLKRRGTLDNTILIVESDHSMITYFKDAIDLKEKVEENCDFSSENDYFIGAAASIGFIYERREKPGMMEKIEDVLEKWRIKNPLTGEMECPVMVYNRREMLSGKTRPMQNMT